MASISRRNLLALTAQGALAPGLFTGCSSPNFALPETDITRPNINPMPRSALGKGGNFSTYFDQYMPTNWNFYHIDGNLQSVSLFNEACIPKPLLADAQGNKHYNPHILAQDPTAELVNGKFVVTYTIKPGLQFSDGSPLNWECFAVLARMNSGRESGAEIVKSAGYELIESVHPGESDSIAVVVFSQPYSEWRCMFQNLYPAHSIDTADKFNTAFITDLPPTCGPFRLKNLNRATQRLVLERDPRWPGPPALLDTITFYILDVATSLTAFKNNDLDAVPVSATSDLAVTSTIPGVIIRKALNAGWYFLAFNGAKGRITSELAIRQAIHYGVNTALFRKAIAGAFAKHIPPLGNHIYINGQDGYQDNSFPYDPAHANDILDQAGWKRSASGVRSRDGRPLRIPILSRTDNFRFKIMSQLLQHDLEALGIQAIIHAVPSSDFYPNYYTKGNYSLAISGWVSEPGPFSSSYTNYYLPYTHDAEGNKVIDSAKLAGNHGAIGSEQINAWFHQALATTDTAAQKRLGNLIDKQLWQLGHSLPLLQEIEGMAMTKEIGNYGEFMLGGAKWENIGYVRS